MILKMGAGGVGTVGAVQKRKRPQPDLVALKVIEKAKVLSCWCDGQEVAGRP